jgi:hypothetical protein
MKDNAHKGCGFWAWAIEHWALIILPYASSKGGGFPTTHKGKRFAAAFYEVRRTKLDTAPAN